MRRDLPSGTVTFLFTDVEGSTKLLHELGAEEYAEKLAEHRRLVREACTSHGGVEVDTQGDAFFVAFSTATGALETARAITEDLASGPVRLRMGVHTGTPLLTDEGYVGPDVHRAARIAAAGHGGQVLVSSSTAGLVELELRDLGEHRFKDLAAPERVYQLGDQEFASLKSLYRTNLPVPATPFLGRQRELAEVVELISREDVRLLTLTGPGGTGKTRLSLQAAAEAAERYPDGITWIPLAPLRDAALLLPTIAHALELKEEPDKPLAETLTAALTGKQVLLLLDNLEHLLPRAARELATFTSTAGPVLLVTSRERLQLQGEQLYPVPTLEESDAVALFLARARGLDPGFAANGAVAELCSRLDNLPLALELAAARTVVFSPSQLLERVSQRLDLLKGGRDADPRQKTLRATIEWSYDLLDLEEQRLFRSLSVFAGGCTYEAAEKICGADPDTLHSLLDKSLLRRRDAELGPRYWMLETIREFALEKLDENGETKDALGAHAGWYAKFAASLSWPVREFDPTATAALTNELANVRAGLECALARGDAAVAGDYLVGLWFLWLIRGHGREAFAAADRWLTLDRSELAVLDRVPGLLGASEIVRFTVGDPDRVVHLKAELIAIARANPNAVVHNWAMKRMLPATLTDLAWIEVERGNLETAEQHAEEALRIRKQLGYPKGIAHAQDGLAAIAFAKRDFARSREILFDAVAGRQEAGGGPDMALDLAAIAQCDLLLGDLDPAWRRMAQALSTVDSKDVGFLIFSARVLAMLHVRSGNALTAARLIGAADRLESNSSVTVSDHHETAIQQKVLAAARDLTEPDAYERAYSEGELLDAGGLFELVAAAVADRESGRSV